MEDFLFYQGKSIGHHTVCVTVIMQTSATRRTLYPNQIVYFLVSFNLNTGFEGKELKS